MTDIFFWRSSDIISSFISFFKSELLLEHERRDIHERSNKYCFIIIILFGAKVRIIREKSKEYFKVVDFEDATVADFATFAGGKYLYVSPASVKIVSQGDTISEFKDTPIRLPQV